jgi:hypothetical protein
MRAPQIQIPPETRIFDLTVAQLRELIANELRGAESPDDLIDQRTSPLGKRRHGDAVRRRIAEGLHGAARIGRRWCLTTGALQEELARMGREPRGKSEPSAADQLRAELNGGGL